MTDVMIISSSSYGALCILLGVFLGLIAGFMIGYAAFGANRKDTYQVISPGTFIIKGGKVIAVEEAAFNG